MASEHSGFRTGLLKEKLPTFRSIGLRPMRNEPESTICGGIGFQPMENESESTFLAETRSSYLKGQAHSA